ncbi:hypothetical protein PISMIDRAFT_428047 [Pisolithus microcarpus 441]|uniref:Uncharacterized protein n=1 Tax=Pisolithus microcarpus 441 TaxID=765257 RepID=A0A0C9YQP3_9AGAM|nr:hypothetical protein PISMIDRAFT_428047 [Pisolithus microcarpus 441]
MAEGTALGSENRKAEPGYHASSVENECIFMHSPLLPIASSTGRKQKDWVQKLHEVRRLAVVRWHGFRGFAVTGSELLR